MQHKILVTYFSASGITARAAKEIAASVGADVQEIAPAAPYSAADLNWMDKSSRTTKESKDENCRPPMAADIDIKPYDTIFLGFPVWFFYSCIVGYVGISLILWGAVRVFFKDLPLDDGEKTEDESNG